MFHHTAMTDERISDLRKTAAELRLERSINRRIGWTANLRLRTGTALMTAGEALVSGVRPVVVGRPAR